MTLPPWKKWSIAVINAFKKRENRCRSSSSSTGERTAFFRFKKSLDRLGLRGKIAIVGIAKRLEEIYFPQDPIPLYLDKKSESLKVIQYLRNEAHRFGITFHRNKRSKGAIRSGLDAIPGVGPKTKENLLKKFKSFKRIKAAPIEDLIALLGEKKGNNCTSTCIPTLKR